MPPPLPQKPDFSAIELEAPKSADSRTRLLSLIGNLAFCWSNNESLLIYLLMLLLDTDEVAAAIVFSTLNTTRARLDLVHRLAKVRVSDRKLAKDLDRLIDRFNSTTRLRNEFNHATFNMNERGEITHTRSLRIVERKGKLSFGETREVDEARLRELSDAVRELTALNRDIWDFFPRLQAHMAARGRPAPAQAATTETPTAKR